MTTAMIDTAAVVLANPKVPPADVLRPGVQLLGYAKWVAVAIGITSMMWGGAFLWLTENGYAISENPGRQRLRILTALFGGIVVTSSSALAMWVIE